MRALPIALSFSLIVACGDDKSSPSDTSDTADVSDTSDTDTETPVPADQVFAFRAFPGQSMGDGPFPNDGLIGDDGLVDLAPLKNDARFGDMSRDELLDRTDAQIAKKGAFGFISSVFFPMNAEPDLTTFEGSVSFVALSGPESGKAFPGLVSWSASTRALSVFPAWGHYLVPGSTYGVFVTTGVKTKDGTTIAAPQAFADTVALTAESPSAELAHAREAFAPLRDHLSTIDTTAVIGTVFTTEATLPWFDSLVTAATSWPLEAPSRTVAFTTTGDPIVATDIKGEDLGLYFGTPVAPFATTPTAWGPGSRSSAAGLPGGTAYAGGSFAGDIGYVVNGSLVMPSYSATMPSADLIPEPIVFDNGAPVLRSRVMVPFTAYFCDSHLDGDTLDPNATVRFAIFTHGGTAIRSDALSSAVANCQNDYATIAVDLPFHGGRQDVRKVGDLIATTRVDDENSYSGKRRGNEGFVPDGIGDNGSATATVGNLFALADNFDPDVLEANLIAISVEHIVLARYLRDPTKLAALFGVTIDNDRLVTQSLSFGTSFTTAALTHPALNVKGVVQSVGSGGMLTLNLPIAPNNAALASGIVSSLLSLQSTIPEIMEGAWEDPFLALLQWLSQRGDPQGYAPFVLRHRASDRPAFHVFGSGDSWDETLSSLAQLSFNAAWGVPVFTAGADWTLDASIPGAATVDATAWTAPIKDNLTAPGGPFSAAYFYNADSCHAQVVTPICEWTYLPPYPPATARPTPLYSVSPVCALQTPMIEFIEAIADGVSPEITAPRGDCDSIYAR